MTKETQEKLAQFAYESYCKAVGGVAFNGDPLPTWEVFASDEKKVKQANAWRDVARSVVDAIGQL